jgi:hypothetical protein
VAVQTAYTTRHDVFSRGSVVTGEPSDIVSGTAGNDLTPGTFAYHSAGQWFTATVDISSVYQSLSGMVVRVQQDVANADDELVVAQGQVANIMLRGVIWCEVGDEGATAGDPCSIRYQNGNVGLPENAGSGDSFAWPGLYFTETRTAGNFDRIRVNMGAV